MNLFLDTSVLFAAFVTDHEHHDRAFPLVDQVHQKRDSGFVSAHTIVELYSTLTWFPRTPRLTSQEVGVLIEENVLKYFTLVTLTGKEYGTFLLESAKQSISGGQIYDALILACAEKCNADRIYTLNIRHFQHLVPSRIADRVIVP